MPSKITHFSVREYFSFILLPQDHPHVGIRSNLREEEQCVLQFLLALLPLLLTGKRGVLLLIIQEAVEKILVLEAQLLVHCITTTQSELNINTDSTCVPAESSHSLTLVEYTLLQQHLPHAHSLNTRADAGALLHLPVNQFSPDTTLPGKYTDVRSQTRMSC